MCTVQGLACGANAEGTPFGRLALAPLPGAHSGNSYAKHFHHFIRNLTGKAKAFADTYLRQKSEPRALLLPQTAVPQQQPQQHAPQVPQPQYQQPQQVRPADLPAQLQPQKQQLPGGAASASGQPVGSQPLPVALAPPGMPAGVPAASSLAAVQPGIATGVQPAVVGTAGTVKPPQ